MSWVAGDKEFILTPVEQQAFNSRIEGMLRDFETRFQPTVVQRLLQLEPAIQRLSKMEPNLQGLTQMQPNLQRLSQNEQFLLTTVQQSKARLDQFESKATQHSAQTQDTARRLTQIEPNLQRLAQIETQLQRLEATAQQSKAEMQETKQLVAQLSPNLQRLSQLEPQVKRLEATVQQSTGRLDQLESTAARLSQIEPNVQRMEATVQQGQGRIAQCEASVAQQAQQSQQAAQRLAQIEPDLQRIETTVQQGQGKLEQVEASAAQQAQQSRQATQRLAQIEPKIQGIERAVQQATQQAAQKFSQIETQSRALPVPPLELERFKAEMEAKHRAETNVFIDKMKMLSATSAAKDRELLSDDGHKEVSEVVGCISLSQDVFTARLLLNFGILFWQKVGVKQWRQDHDASHGDRSSRMQQRDLRLEQNTATSGSDSGDEEDWETYKHTVNGIEYPQIKMNENGDYDESAVARIKRTWNCLCFVTTLLQFVIMFSIVYKLISSEKEVCSDKGDNYFVFFQHAKGLCVSKAMAIVVAVCTFGNELLDTLNYYMVSELLKEQKDWHCCSAVFRVFVSTVILMVTALVLYHADDAMDLWTNMAAFAFVLALGELTLKLAKSGVFGHHTSKAMTSLNFDLNFMQSHNFTQIVRARKFVKILVTILVIVGAVFMLTFSPHCYH